MAQRSAAIRITKPPDSPGSKGKQASTPPKEKELRNDKSQRLCRNITLYDQCRTPNCPFYHPPKSDQLEASSTTTVVESSPTKVNELKASHLQAPVFVPKASAPVFNVSPTLSTPALQAPRSPGPQLSHVAPEWNQESYAGASQMQHEYEDPAYDYDTLAAGAMYMPQQPLRPPIDYHLYTAPMPYVSNPPLGQNPLHSFFIPDDLRRMFLARLEALKWKPNVPPHPPPPAELGVYHDLVPLESVRPTSSRVYGHPAPVYRAMSTVDGNVYLLRRIEGFRVTSEAAFAALDTWRRLRHPNIVTLREAFTTKAFGDNSLVLVYDFHPNATTLWDEHLNQNAESAPKLPHTARRQGMPINERLLWSYVTQIANALKAIHSSGLAARALDPNKLLLTGKNRVRLNGGGILDVLSFDPSTPPAAYQAEDMISFGKLILSMGCEFYQPGHHPAQAIDHLERVYSPDVKNLVIFLLGKPGPYKTFDEVLHMIGPRILNELDALQFYNDSLEDEAMREMENGRIVRVLSKMGFVNERAEFEYDPRWADTGDRYIIKLFRDYVFHSVSPTGAPVLDLSHVITCLNKLDAGLDERLMLVSRDERSCLVVTYREIKSCIEAAYTDLRNAGDKLPTGAMGAMGISQRAMGSS